MYNTSLKLLIILCTLIAVFFLLDDIYGKHQVIKVLLIDKSFTPNESHTGMVTDSNGIVSSTAVTIKDGYYHFTVKSDGEVFTIQPTPKEYMSHIVGDTIPVRVVIGKWTHFIYPYLNLIVWKKPY